MTFAIIDENGRPVEDCDRRPKLHDTREDAQRTLEAQSVNMPIWASTHTVAEWKSDR